MSTKQDKFYDTLRQTQANTFSDGLNMDLHPLTTPNTILTDCINGTMITYNDNEFVLQNERGNTKIDNAQLSPGFIPVGMKEHNGILYIVSHNPQTKESEIGTYPSPNKIQEHGVNLIFEGNVEIKSNYTDFDQNIKYYDYNTIVTNQDNYTCSSSHNPLVVLEHFILNKTGEVTKTKLIGIEGTETYRFTHEEEGTLGYRYRPYYLSSITPSIIPSKGGSNAQLVIEAISDDKELYEVLKTQDDIKFKYDIVIEFVNGENKLEFKSESLNIDKWDYTFNLENVSKLSLLFENKFTIENEDGNIECEYNHITEELIANNTVDNTSTSYKEVNFNIIPRIYTNNDNYITYDNLIVNYKTTVNVVFKQASWFTTFQYKLQGENSNKLSIWATLDLSRFDIDWQTNVQTINEASYKLYEIDKSGNIKGKYVNKPVTVYKSPLFDVVDSKLNMKSHDLVFNDNKYNFSLSDVETLVPIQYSNITTSQCVQLTSENKARYVRYDKVNDNTYNVVLLNDNHEELSSTNIYSDIMCSEDMKKMIDEYFDKTNGKVNYTINDVPFEYNKVYLLELTFPINGKINKASFIIVTAPSMLAKYKENNVMQRMDEILLTEWFEPSVEEEVFSIEQDDYRNPSSYINNLIDVKRIKDKTDDEIEKYAMQFFLKYNQLFTNPTDNEIPALGEQFNCEKTIKNKSEFDCTFEYNNALSINKFNVRNIIINALSLDVDTEKSKFHTQTSERKYLYDIFNGVNDVIIKCDGAYSRGVASVLSLSESVSDTAISINTYKMGSSNVFSLGWTNWLDDGRMEVENKYDCTKVTKDNCYVTKKGDFTQYYTWNTAGISELFGGPVQILYKFGLNGGLNYSNIKDASNVNYSGQNKKIFIHSKHRDKKSYMLLGIDGLNDSEENSKLACNVLFKHGYYTKPCNRQVYQYVFKIENDVIKTKNIKTDNISIPIKIYPNQCVALFKDYSQYNVQNWNNLSTLKFSSNYTINKFDVNDNIIDNENVYKYFLEKLGMIINSQLFDNNILQEQINDNIIQFDVKNDNLFIDDINKINNKDGRDYSNAFYDMRMPELLYDKENKIIYCNITNDIIDQFEYIGGICVRPVEWNYSIPFDTIDGFWPDGSLDNIEKLNDYHSLLFYKLTTYNGDQSQNSN